MFPVSKTISLETEYPYLLQRLLQSPQEVLPERSCVSPLFWDLHCWVTHQKLPHQLCQHHCSLTITSFTTASCSCWSGWHQQKPQMPTLDLSTRTLVPLPTDDVVALALEHNGKNPFPVSNLNYLSSFLRSSLPSSLTVVSWFVMISNPLVYDLSNIALI